MSRSTGHRTHAPTAPADNAPAALDREPFRGHRAPADNAPTAPDHEPFRGHRAHSATAFRAPARARLLGLKDGRGPAADGDARHDPAG